MSNKKRKILVTSALPYANGSLHLGHMVEHIQSDIWVKYQRLRGHQCFFVCGDDAHGTPIMLQAEKQGITSEQLIAKYYQEHIRDLKDFLISYDNFHTTHSKENQELATYIYNKLFANGDISKKNIKQFFDTTKNLFLPDRYVKGQCPKCNAEDQYGDNCEKCGAHYSSTEIKNPISAVSGTTPIQKDSEHYFFCLHKHEEMLKNWINNNHIQIEITHKLKEWFNEGLKDWDISRDEPYFGFEIPNAPGKYFYVWLDAPIGYIASFKNLCTKNNSIKFEEYWHDNSNTELYHFVGKDIVYFHALFWPAMLTGSGFRTPTHIFVHGFLTINGEKMSKSRGTFINARDYLNYFNPEYLRYYFAAKLTSSIDDVDINFEDFVIRINADLVGKFINIASRCAMFINKNFDNTLSTNCHDQDLFKSFINTGEQIAIHYETLQYGKAIREIMSLADQVNRFIDQQKPWGLIKDPTKQQLTQEVCSLGLNLFKVLTAYIKPILPNTAKAIEEFLNIPELTWDNYNNILLNHKINKFNPLLNRIELKQVKAMQDSITSTLAKEQTPVNNTITMEDFAKVDLRIARIQNAEHVEGAEKLLKLTVDLGTETKQIFAGIKTAYDPEDLIGKLTVVVTNLVPRKMRFGVSEGMVLAAGPGGKEIWILEPHQGAQPGMRVK